MKKPIKLKFRPSGIHRNLSCPGAAFVNTAVKTRSSSYADEGNTAHAHLAAELTGEPLEKFLADKCDPVVLPESDLELIVRMAELVRNIALLDDCEIFVEFGLASTFAGIEMSGTADVLLVAEDRLIVLDYKHGEGRRVRVEGNPQLSCYALMASRVIPKPIVEFGVIQPRGVGEGLKMWSPPEGYFEIFEKNLESAIRRSFVVPLEFNSGPWCWECAGEVLGACPKKLEEALEFAVAVETGMVDDVLDAATNKKRLEFTPPFWLLDRAKVAATLASKLESEAFLRLSERKEVPGWTLKETKGRVRWAVPEEIPDVLSRLSGRPREDFYIPGQPKIIAIGDAKKLLKEIDFAEHVIKPATRVLVPSNEGIESLFEEVDD